MSIKISIIVPIFNEEKYLPLFLDSLIKQTLPADEINISDNNSTDKSLIIANLYMTKLPIKIIHQYKKGILPTIEKAWKTTTGEIIVRTDADVILPKNYLKQIANYYNSHPKTQASTGPIMSAEFHIIYSILYIIGTFLCNYIISIVRGYPLIMGANTVIRRNAMQKIDGYKTNIKTIDDHLLTDKLHSNELKIDYVIKQYNYTSIRRWLSNPLNIIKSIIINFNNKYYIEKSS